MALKKKTLEHIKEHPVIPVYYHDNPETCITVLKACYEGGIRVFEFTNRGQYALENLLKLTDFKNQYLPDLLLGIGTIKNVHQAETFIKAGADFIVSPILKEDIAQIAKANNALWIPGCMTPTEINFAEELGAELIKLFPGDTLKPAFLKAIKPLFPELMFMPTGGVSVDPENIDGWLEAGVTAMGFGSKLFQNNNGVSDYHWLTERCQWLVNYVKNKY